MQETSTKRCLVIKYPKCMKYKTQIWLLKAFPRMLFSFNVVSIGEAYHEVVIVNMPGYYAGYFLVSIYFIACYEIVQQWNICCGYSFIWKLLYLHFISFNNSKDISKYFVNVLHVVTIFRKILFVIWRPSHIKRTNKSAVWAMFILSYRMFGKLTVYYK